jgi:hypothetical protein
MVPESRRAAEDKRIARLKVDRLDRILPLDTPMRKIAVSPRDTDTTGAPRAMDSAIRLCPDAVPFCSRRCTS